MPLRSLLEALRAMRRCPAEALLLRATGREAAMLELPGELDGLAAPFEIAPPPGMPRSGPAGATWMPQLGSVAWEEDPDVHADPDLLRRWSRGRLREAMHAAGVALDARDPAAAAFAVSRVAAFLRRCPPGSCEHWRSGMEIGLRAVRLVHAASRLRAARAAGIAVPSLAPLARALEMHEQALRSRTDWRLHRTGNHFLVALAARVVVGAALPEHPERSRRLRADVRLFLSELDRQVGGLGMHFESSTHYHLLVAECAAHVRAAAGRCGAGSDRSRALAALAGLALPALLRPDGSLASVGDGDDESFAPACLGPEPPPVLRGAEIARALGGSSPVAGSQAWSDGGIHVLALDGLHATISSCGPGRAGTGGHFHDDATAFELWLGGPLLGHRGTGSYAADLRLREALRSVRSHAALQVGEREMNDACGRHAFRRRHRAHAFVVALPGAHLAIGHHGFVLPPPGAAVLRTFRMDARDGFVVEDHVSGAGTHRLTLRLPWAPGIDLEPPRRDPDGSATLTASRSGRAVATCRLEAPALAGPVPARGGVPSDALPEIRTSTAVHWPRQGEALDALTTELRFTSELPVVIRHSVRPIAWGGPGSP